MTADDGERLLGYALPVIRFLGVRRLRIPCYRINADRPAFDPAHADPAGLRPSPEGMWDSVIRAAAGLLPEDVRGDRDAQFVLDAVRAAWWVEGVGWPGSEPTLPLVVSEQPRPPNFGLGTFLKGVWYEPLGHLILADRLEDQSGPSAITTAFRASEAEPYRPTRYGEWLSHDAFRWRWLEREVLCYFSRCCTCWPEDQPERETVGFVVGLLHGAEGAAPRRWARWVADEEIGRQLAAELGVSLPASDQPWVDL